MTDSHEPQPWEALEQLTEAGDARELDDFLDRLPAGEAARALSRLDADDQQKVLTTLTPEDAADLIEEIPEAQAAALIEQLPAGDAAAIIGELPSDEQADIITALAEADAEAILAEMDPARASDARRLAEYPPDVAGGLMVTEYLSYPETATVQDVLDDLRSRAEEYAEYDVQYAYITDPRGRLVGVLRLRDLLLAPGPRSLADLVIRDPHSVADRADLDELDSFFDRHAFFGVPVIGDDGGLVGVVRRHDVEEALGDRADHDYLKSQGIVSEELRTMPVLQRAGRRLSWLSVNVVLNIVAACVIALYEETIQAVIALAVFLPIISDMSGCSGNQAVAVSMRELTLGLVTPLESLRVWGKELSVGLINGIVLGTLIGVVAWAWKGNPWLGGVVGGAMMLNTVVAVSIGGIVPLVLKRLRLDPALASGPILTTVTDMCGFFLVLSFATLALRHLA